MGSIGQGSPVREILRRAMWVTLGSIVGRALPLLAGAFLSRTHGLESFAVIGLVLTWAAVVPSLTSWGIGLVATQMMARLGEASYRTVVKWSVMSTIAGLIIVHVIVFTLGREWVSAIYPGLSLDKIGFAALSVGVFSSFFVLIQAFLNGAHHPKLLSGLLALSGVIQGVALGLIALADDLSNGVTYLLVATVLATCIAVIAFYSRVLRKVHPGHPAELSVRSWMSKIIPAVASSATVAPVTFVCASMVAANADGARQLGAFFALEQISLVLIYIPSLIAQSSVPVLSKLVHENESRAIGHVLRMAGYQFLILAIALCIAVPTAPLVLGAYGQLSDFGLAYLLLLLNVLLSVPMGTIGTYLQASGKFATGSVLNVSWAALFIVSSMMLKGEGAAGIEAARLIATCFLGLATGFIVYMNMRRLRISSASSLAT